MASGRYRRRFSAAGRFTGWIIRDFRLFVTLFIQRVIDSLSNSLQVRRPGGGVYSLPQINGEREVKLESAWKLCWPGVASASGVRSAHSIRKLHNWALLARCACSPDRKMTP